MSVCNTRKGCFKGFRKMLQDSWVRKVVSYALGEQDSVPGRNRDFSLHFHLHNVSGTHAAAVRQVPEIVSPRIWKRRVIITKHLHLCWKLWHALYILSYVSRNAPVLPPPAPDSKLSRSRIDVGLRVASRSISFGRTETPLPPRSPSVPDAVIWNRGRSWNPFLTSLQDMLVQIAYSLHVLIQLF
jgi:hypothetical protein